MSVNRESLKKIRWFSNGVWQFQPHLHYMQNLYKNDEEFAERIALMEHGGVLMKDNHWFKMELEEPAINSMEGN